MERLWDKDIEDWLPLPGYELCYTISTHGRVKRVRDGAFRAIGKNGKGYPILGLTLNGKTKSATIHRLVYRTFKGEIPDGYEINHIHGVKTDNWIGHLEAVTPRENIDHAVRLGLMRKKPGQKKKFPLDFCGLHAKLNEEQVREIRRLNLEGHTYAKLSVVYSVSDRAISKIVKRQRWKWIA